MADYEQPRATEPPEPMDEDKVKEYEELIAGWVEDVDSVNLVPYFLEQDGDQAEGPGRKFLKSIAEQVCKDTDRARDDSEEYREKRRQNFRMLTGFLPKKSFPYDGCANAHAPVFMERHLRLAANVYTELFHERDTILAVKPSGPDDYEAAEILSVHGNYQLRNELTDFLPQQQMGVSEFFGGGSVFSHSWFDEVKGRNRHDILNCEEFVIPYVWTTTQVDLSDVPWKTRIIRRYKHELQVLKTKAWAQVDFVVSKAAPGWDHLDDKNKEMASRQEGIRPPEHDPHAPYIFYDYVGWARMPGETELRPINAVVEIVHKTVVLLRINEEEDWRDRIRYDRQVAELQEYTAGLQKFEQDMMQFQQAQQAEQQIASHPGLMPDEQSEVQQAIMSEPLPPPQQPVPPSWLQDYPDGQPPPVKRVPIEMFAHGRCAHNPSGSMGLSFGQVLADQNRLVDEAYNRLYDAATLANVWSIIVPEALDLGSSTLAAAPGKVYKAKNFTGEQLKNSIVELKATPANNQLMDIIRFASENADAAVAAPGVLSGEAGKSGETFRGIATRVERATKQLTAAGLNYLGFLEQIVKNNARLNSIFLPEVEVIEVGNHFADIRRTATVDPATGQPKAQIEISRSLYRRNYSVTFTADIRFASSAQRIAEADEVMGMAMQVPELANNPSFKYAAITECLRARGKAGMIPMMGPAPPPPGVPFGTPPAPPPGMVAPGQPPPNGPQAGPPQPGPPPGAVPPDGIQRPAVAPGPIQGPRPQGVPVA